jgi:two-component system chemotaxis sensor kinase CheA
VFADHNRSMGLVVDEIVDIAEDRINVEVAADSPGRMGSAVIAGHATDVIDAGFYLTRAFGDWFGSMDTVDSGLETIEDKHILVVDDSVFFRNLLTPMLVVKP